MKLSVEELDVMPESRATELLGECCGSRRWVSQMLAKRPFGSRARVLSTADDIWRSLDPADWREAFSHHPRIGEGMSAAPQTERGSAWAAGEQSGMQRAGDQMRQELATANRQYEQRFGYIYIVCATGMSANEMLSVARERMQNDPKFELGIAAEEQRKITRLRLEKLLGAVDA